MQTGAARSVKAHMGREATCHCKWGDEEGDCKVLLESGELIVRLGMRRRVPLSSLAGVSTHGGKLIFRVGEDSVELRLGPEVAQRWARAIATPPPSLARKLGISRTTKLRVFGNIESEELKAAVAEAGAVDAGEANLILICANSQSEVDRSLAQCFKDKTCSGPLWMVYPKGAHSEVKESALRELLRNRGFIDTKVASVSAKLTAARFTKRKETVSK
jgi:hypothetical protein